MTDYISNITTPQGNKNIGGPQFDDEWVMARTTLGAAFTMAAGATKTFDLSDIIPDDGYDYDIQVSGYMGTGETSGNACGMDIVAGSAWNNGTNKTRIGRVVTRTNSSELNAGNATLPISASDRAITILNSDASGTSGSRNIYFQMYRRIGINGEEENYIENFATPDETIPFGGEVVDSEWKVPDTATERLVLSSRNITAGSSVTIDLSSILPNDGYNYECLFTITGVTGSSSGNWFELYLASDIQPNIYTARAQTRTNSTRVGGKNAVIVVGSQRTLIVSTYSGAGTANSVSVYFNGYKRIGTNNTANGNLISNINGKPIGGNKCYYPWVYKSLQVFDSVIFGGNETKTYTISNYLPDNDSQYEVLMWGWTRTNNTSGSQANIWVRGNVSESGLIGACNTRTNNSAVDGGNIKTICKQDDNGNMTITAIHSTAGTTGGIGLYIQAYRKVGTNGG